MPRSEHSADQILQLIASAAAQPGVAAQPLLAQAAALLRTMQASTKQGPASMDVSGGTDEGAPVDASTVSSPKMPVNRPTKRGTSATPLGTDHVKPVPEVPSRTPTSRSHQHTGDAFWMVLPLLSDAEGTVLLQHYRERVAMATADRPCRWLSGR